MDAISQSWAKAASISPLEITLPIVVAEDVEQPAVDQVFEVFGQFHKRQGVHAQEGGCQVPLGWPWLLTMGKTIRTVGWGRQW